MTNRWGRELRKRKPGDERKAFRTATDEAYARVVERKKSEASFRKQAAIRRAGMLREFEKKLSKRMAGTAFNFMMGLRPLRNGNRYFSMPLSVGG